MKDNMLNIVVLVIVTKFCTPASSLTTQQEHDVRVVCSEVIRNNQNLNMAAGMVRLVFHDCLGGCDGCIDLDLIDPTGDRANAGLRRYIDALELRYADAQSRGIGSRADYWALCAAEAVRQARAEANGDNSLRLSMRYGRTDCNTSPRDTDNSNFNNFPNPRLGLDHVLSWCNTQFGLGPRDCTALMGAHTLGGADPRFSGFRGPWVRNPRGLNNGYYRELARPGWQQTNVAPQGQTPRWQYVRGGRSGRRRGGGNGGPALLMLNTDACLRQDIRVTPDGRGPNRLRNAPDSQTKQFVTLYAGNDNLWIQDFMRVFTHMMETGYDSSGLSAPTGGVVPLPPIVNIGSAQPGGTPMPGGNPPPPGQNPPPPGGNPPPPRGNRPPRNGPPRGSGRPGRGPGRGPRRF